MVVFGRKVGSPTVLRDGCETGVARGSIIRTDDSRSVDLYAFVTGECVALEQGVETE